MSNGTSIELMKRWLSLNTRKYFCAKGGIYLLASSELVLLLVINIAIKQRMKPTEKVNAAERDVRTVPLIPQPPSFAMENFISADLRSFLSDLFFIFDKFIYSIKNRIELKKITNICIRSIRSTGDLIKSIEMLRIINNHNMLKI